MQSYLIRKSPGPRQERQVVARLNVDDEGKVIYELMVDDREVERVLAQAQNTGGLYCRIAWREEEDGSVVREEQEIFVKTTDPAFLEAIEANLPSGLVDRD